MTTGAFSWNVGKLFSELKLVTDNLLFIYAEANWEATESQKKLVHVFFNFASSDQLMKYVKVYSPQKFQRMR